MITDKVKCKVTTVGNRKTNKIVIEVVKSADESTLVAKDVGREAATRMFHIDSAMVAEKIKGINTYAGVENAYPEKLGVPIGETSVDTSADSGAEHATAGYLECCQHPVEIDQIANKCVSVVSNVGSKATTRAGESSQQCEEGAIEESAWTQIKTVSCDAIVEQTVNAATVHEFTRVTGIGKIVIVEQVEEARVQTCKATGEAHGEVAVEVMIAQHGGSTNVKNREESSSKKDADGGSTGGVLPKVLDPVATADVVIKGQAETPRSRH